MIMPARRIRSALTCCGLAALAAVVGGVAGAADLPVPALGEARVSFGIATQVQQGTNLTINQASERATLNWQSFDIAPGHSVRFNQPGASSVALNRIFQNDPSRIQGSLTANGQIYLVNRNGIVFANGAQVQANSLIASTLDIDDDIHEQIGIVGAINEGSGRAALVGSGAMGAIQVAAGAKLETDAGGRILLAGPVVENRGTIRTPDGQAIIAASRDRVYLASSTDNNLRGLVVEVDTGGTATNLGEITADRGNVSILGLAVNQSGTVRATTSLNVNGSIRLAARDRATVLLAPSGNLPQATRAGALNIGPSSLTEVAPDRAEATATAVDSQPQSRSRIELMGETIDIRSASLILARSGNVDIQATQNPRAPGLASTADNASRLSIAAGAVLDVSGLDSATVSVARNVVTVEARGNELRDSPLQRDGVLRGQTLQVDIRQGSPLLDISGASAGIRRALDERLATGGNVNLVSEGLLSLAAGANVNVSGGAVTYTGGNVRTSKLVAADGRIIDISAADPNERYTGLFGATRVTYDRWGVKRDFTLFAGAESAQFEAGYVEGQDAGSIVLAGRTAVLDGNVIAATTRGRFQRQPPGALPDAGPRAFDQVPLAARLALRFGSLGDVGRRSALVLAARDSATPVAPDGRPRNPDILLLGPSWLNSGVGAFTLESTGTIAVTPSTALSLPAFSSLSLTAGQIDVGGSVTLPGGAFAARAEATRSVPAADVRLEVASGASVSVAGRWINDVPALNPVAPASALVYDAGSIDLSSAGTLRVAAGAVLDADGGARLDAEGVLRAGRGGSISVALTGTTAATLSLEGRLRAFALQQGGTLSLTANGAWIGRVPFGSPELPPEVLRLGSDFFSQGGFSAFTINANQRGIVVAADTQLRPQQVSRVLADAAARAPTGTSLDAISSLGLLEDYLRRPVDLALASRQRLSGGIDPSVRIDARATVALEPGGRLALSSDSSVFIDGNLSAPAGSISATLLPFGVLYDPAQKIWVGSQASLSSRAVAVLQPDLLGLRRGVVLGGGSVSLTANRGSIVLNGGSLLDVSGVAQVLDLPDYSRGPSTGQTAPVAVDGAAGRIALAAAETIVAQGALRGNASGVAGSQGGTLAVTLDPRSRNEDAESPLPFPQGPRIIDVGSSAPIVIGALAAIPGPLNGLAVLDPRSVSTGGFAALELTARPAFQLATAQSTAAIRFNGVVDLAPSQRLVLDAPIIAGREATATLRSTYVAIGSTDTLNRLDGSPAAVGGGTIQADPVAGTSTLVVDARMLELVGDSVLQGFAPRAASGVAPVQLRSSGDLRLRGTQVAAEITPRLAGSLRTAGDLSLVAAQVYPTTLSEFALVNEGPAGSVLSIQSATGPVPTAPLSAGGSLTLRAPVIEQSGVLRAPFGAIALVGDRVTLGSASETSVSGAGTTVLFGQTQFLTDLVLPLRNFVRVFETLPAKALRLEAPVVDIRSGATLDVSGGGTLLATEFLPGPGGSTDILVPGAIAGAFAIVPTLGTEFAPWDPIESPLAGLQPGSTIRIAGGAGIAAGTYAVLPARYALLGGYLVTPVENTTDFNPGQVLQTEDGFPIVAGRLGFVAAGEESRWRGFKIEPASWLRQRAEYAETSVETLFADRTGPRVADAGSLTIAASRTLNLAGRLAAQTGAGRGPRVDIVASDVAIVAARSAAPTSVELVAADLSRFGAASLLIGGTRRDTEDGIAIDVTATQVRLDRDARLASPDVTLVARDRVQVAAGASLVAEGAAVDAPEVLEIAGDAAIARVSTGEAVELRRSGTSGARGSLEVARGAILDGPRSILLDATRDNLFAGTLRTAGGSIALGASAVTLGDAPAGTPGLVLGGAALAALDRTDLRLRSGSTVSLVGPVSLSLRSLALDATGLRASGVGDRTISATQLSFANRSGATPGSVAPGTGRLNLDAGVVEIGTGRFAIDGFGGVVLRASEALVGTGTGSLAIDGPTTVATPRLITKTGASAGLDVAGLLTITPLAEPSTATTAVGLAGRWDLGAESISFGSRLVLPSGQVSLAARGPGGVVLENGALINVAGIDLSIVDQVLATPGGSVSLVATQGDVRLRGSATVDVSGAPSGSDAGRLGIVAPMGSLVLDAGSVLRAASGGSRAGIFEADVRTFADFAALNRRLEQGQFSALRSYRQRSGDLQLAAGDTLTAAVVRLVADDGAIAVDGTIDASGVEGGRVELAAARDLLLGPTARVAARARATGESGGFVDLSSRAGTLSIAAAAAADRGIDVRGVDAEGAADDTGRVRLAAARIGATGIAIGALAGPIVGARRLDLEAVRVYDATQAASVTPALVSQVRADNLALAQGGAATLARLGLTGNAAARLVPGVEIRSSGNLTVGSPLDLVEWRDGGVVGSLGLRAAGDLTLSGSISDGFALEPVFDLASFSFVDRVRLQRGDSWSYRFAAGADLASASDRSVGDVARTLTVGRGVTVRTGTGDIALASSGDIRFADANAAVYTAGRNAGVGGLESAIVDVGGEALPFGALFLDAVLDGGEFGTGGGRIDVSARGSLVGTSSGQLIYNWQPRIGGNLPETFGNVPAYWAVDYDEFRQGIGALGGGNVDVRVGGDLRGVSIVIPTTGKALGDGLLDPDQLATGVPFFVGENYDIEIDGGGRLDLDVGGDILGGVFHVGRGAARLRAGGSLLGASATAVAPILALGDAAFDVQARGELQLETVLNPSVIRSLRQALGADIEGYFFSYGDRSGVRLASLTGDVVLRNRLTQLTSAFSLPSSIDQRALLVYPASIELRSYAGDIRAQREMTAFPAPRGSVNLYAAGDIVGSDGAILSQSDADRQLLPGIPNPVIDLEAIRIALLRLRPTGRLVHAAIPVYRGDRVPNVIAAGGSLRSANTDPFAINLSKFSRVLAGDDVQAVSLRVQHADAGNVSVVAAGGDIRQPTVRAPNGRLISDNKVIELAGPGRLDLLAGGSIDLGTSAGILSIGNTGNDVLDDAGAAVTLLVGLGREGAAWSAFADRYLAPLGDYADELAAYLSDFVVDLSLTPQQNFARLAIEDRRPFLLEVFFTELRDSGIAATSGVVDGFERGFQAIRTLFPGDSYRGDLTSLFSRIATLDGGDITLAVPGGLVNAGVASASAIVKTPEELGIVVQRDGNLAGFVDGDFIVNQSRVFALDGGDITIWSSSGDIDAGRGAKTALSVPPPRVSFDADGNVIVEFPPAIAGSGIRAAVSTPGREPGDVFLFAPTGIVNAGDAGIGSAGNVTIGATEVLGADNIDIGGVGVGIPVDAGGLGASLSSASAVAGSATNAATAVAGSAASDSAESAPLAETALGWLDVFVVGYGDENCKPNDAECLKRQKK
jgi:filamentous hemagglutinin